MPDIYCSMIRLRLCPTQYTFRVSRAEQRWVAGHRATRRLHLRLISLSFSRLYVATDIVATFNTVFLLFCVLSFYPLQLKGPGRHTTEPSCRAPRPHAGCSFISLPFDLRPRTSTRASRQMESSCHRVRLALWSNPFYLPSRFHLYFTSAPLSRTTVETIHKASLSYPSGMYPFCEGQRDERTHVKSKELLRRLRFFGYSYLAYYKLESTELSGETLVDAVTMNRTYSNLTSYLFH